MKRIVRATINSWRGLRFALASEAAFRQEVLALAVSIPLAFMIAADSFTRVVLVAVVLLVMLTELVNTAIEKLADRVTLDRDSQIGRVKDLGSAAVALSIVIAVLFWGHALVVWAGLA